MKSFERKSRGSGRMKATCALMSLAGIIALSSNEAIATSKDGVFPSADQVGGQVYVEPVGAGKKLPLDFDAYDLAGKKIDLANVVAGKRSMVVFFISAVPVSVAELEEIEKFSQKNGRGLNVVFVNADTVGSALQGGPEMAVPNTVKTLNVIKAEHHIKTSQMYVAPNDALDPKGVSNRLGFRGLPTSFVLNANGVIEKVFVGPQNWKKASL